MDTTWRAVLWQQFGAAIDMLDDAIRACPDEQWTGRILSDRSPQPEFSQFWYVAYHTLFWLDFYLSNVSEGFAPPAPFTLGELDPAGLLPERVYSKRELQTYLAYGRKKCRATIEALTDPLAPQRCKPNAPDMSVAELLLYNMRHVQEHAAQLSLVLGQKAGLASGWVGRARGQAADE